MNKIKSKKGFTLIEFLIYSGVVVFVMTALTLTGTNMLYGRVKVISMEEIGKSASISMERIAHAIRSAESVTGIGESTLILQMASPAENPTTIFLEDNAIVISIGSPTNKAKLTSKMVNISSLNFQEISSGSVRVRAVFDFYNPSGREEFELSREFLFVENIRKR